MAPPVPPIAILIILTLVAAGAATVFALMLAGVFDPASLNKSTAGVTYTPDPTDTRFDVPECKNVKCDNLGEASDGS